ncbi:23S rRNA (uracil-5-)-methyltransferase RumA [Deinobacterium chartae]|uniref:23S rRNA (Uracil-5-)-methyltransferase RumA n=1 Tax=Deinobacterium chartae TaxID=521158 RepID=A0A841I4J7_9DEIO|nr:23S rRNA (uracil-5-)-methyltransferase RumA [Deinobacterium chartae]
MEVTIEKVVAGGLGLTRVEGRVALVEGALEGERVEAAEALQDSRATLLRMRTVRVLEASPDRVRAQELPTADLAHASYAAQLRYKRGFVQEALERIGRMEGEVGPTRPSPQQWAYRTALQYALFEGRLAYRERGSHLLRTFNQDPLAVQAVQEFTARLNPEKLVGLEELVLRASFHTGEVLAAIVAAGDKDEYAEVTEHLLEAGAVGVSLSAPGERRFARGSHLLAGQDTVLERYGQLDLSVSAVGFAQVNPAAASELYLEAAELAGQGHQALDLYGGAGALGLHLADRYRRVTVLDISKEALRRGRADAERLGIRNVEFARGDALRLPYGVDTVVVDPPRAGLGAEVRDALLRSDASRLVYVSCDPATWARDVGDLARRGFQLVSVTPWDFYPQTAHVEVLSLLER